MDESTKQIMFSSGKDGWRTPRGLFEALHEEFQFTVDGAADTGNHLLPRWWGPGGEEEDAIPRDTSWAGERVYINPPYSRKIQPLFIQKAAFEAQERRAVTVMLLPARTDTRTFHKHIWDKRLHQPREWVRQVRFLEGRVRFVDPTGALLRKGHTNAAPFPSMIIVFEGRG